MTGHTLELSYEFFPPRTDLGKEKLANTRQELASLNPEFYSVTFGAGGSTRDNTLETVLEIQHNARGGACPHLTFVGATNKEIREVIKDEINPVVKEDTPEVEAKKKKATNRVKPIIDNLIGTEYAEDIMDDLIMVLSDTQTMIPIVGKVYAFTYFAGIQ